MAATKYIFGEPEHIEGIGDVYPVKLKDYDDFIEHSVFLHFSINHFEEEFRKYALLELLIFGLKDKEMINDMEKLFSMVLKKPIVFFINENSFGFSGEDTRIDKHNYDKLRSVIMKQNLMFEQKIYKNKIVQEWANKVIQARAKNSIKIEFEDKISTVSVFTGKHYWDLAEYTIYQLETDFNRIIKFTEYEKAVLARTAGADVPLEHYSENLELFRSPYEDLFKDKKAAKLNSAIK